MRVLFATFDGPDYLASCLFDGLQDVLGWASVFDAGHNIDFFPEWSEKVTTNRLICNARPGLRLKDEANFDLLVLNACFLRQHGWDWAWQLRERLKPGGKIAYVEGWDDAAETHFPAFPIDAYFRREILPGHDYGYPAHHLDFAAPARWFDETLNKPVERDIDIYFAGTITTHPVRISMLPVLCLARVKVVLGTSQTFSPAEHFALLRRSKLALCPPGAADCNCLRTWEAIACGAVPVFVGHPSRVRDPWLPNSTFGWFDSAAGLTEFIDHSLEFDLGPIRAQLLEHGREHHTTRTRAEKLLRITMRG